MKQPKFIPVLFHNLEGNDAHLFIRNLGVSSGDIKCIPKTEEKYIYFNKQKGVYPYEYMNGFDKLGKATLPPKIKFFSKLNNADISDADYERAQNVWNVFDMKTMRDYHDLYLKTDVLLQADVMENFRKICKTNYGLDPMWYYTASGLAWDAALKLTKVELELISDPDMYLFIEKGIRGEISTITKRHAIANNKYMAKYDPKKESIHIPCTDANNLYGWAMSQPLPIMDFK
jgi:hypothetical protein